VLYGCGVWWVGRGRNGATPFSGRVWVLFDRLGCRYEFRDGSGRLLGVLYATFLAGRGGSSSSLKVRSMTSEARLLLVLGAEATVDASREDSGGVLASERGVFEASVLRLATR
jgi:hypothetical protein